MINNIMDLREEMIKAFEMVKEDGRKAPQVKEMINAAGKILGSVKAEMEYSFMRGEQPQINFMGRTSGKPLSTTVKRVLSA